MSRRTPSARERPRHLPQLDGLRTVAVLLVLVYHVGRTEDLPLLPGGFVGVDLFFVLSGFLITSLLLREHAETGRVELRRSYVRRLWRLYPALALVSLLTAVVFAFVPGPFGLEAASPLESLVALTYGMSWWSGLELPGGPYLLGLTWSLSVEEHFYLVWPLALLVLLRRGAGAGAVVAVAVLANAWPAVLQVTGADPDRLYFLPDTRFAQILTGCALAALLQRPAGLGRLRRAVSPTSACFAVAGIAVVMAVANRHDAWYWTGRMQLVGLAAAVVGHLVVHGDGPLAAVLGRRPMAVVGTWSYGIYLWHLPLIRLAQPVLGETLVVAVAAAMLSIPIAAASYRFVEQPLLQRRSLRPTRLRVAPARPAVAGPRPEQELTRNAA